MKDHENFETQAEQMERWLDEARAQFQELQPGELSREALGRQQELLSRLQEMREEGLEQLNRASEAGQRLMSGTGAEGKEAVRRRERKLKEAWEALCDDVGAAERTVDENLQELDALDEQMSAVSVQLQNAQRMCPGRSRGGGDDIDGESSCGLEGAAATDVRLFQASWTARSRRYAARWRRRRRSCRNTAARCRKCRRSSAR